MGSDQLYLPGQIKFDLTPINLPLLRSFSLQELRHHPWRSSAAVVSIMLGVALALAVHLINTSALSEFSQAVRSVNGQPDLQLRAASGQLNEALFARVANHAQVVVASPVLEVQSAAVDASGKRVVIKLLGVDTLQVAQVAPSLVAVPHKDGGGGRLAVFAPGVIFLNPSARAQLSGDALQLQSGLQLRPVRVGGTVGAGGAPLAVMDIGALQDFFALGGQLSRIDIKLQPGTQLPALLKDWQLPEGVTAQEPGADTERISNLSRAYRVNLTVLALVALFTGAFLVFSVLSLSVTQRAQQFALLGVLGLTARERLGLVLAESALLGLLGSAVGVGLGALIAWGALKVLGGDLGGGYFSGIAPPLQWSNAAAMVFFALGTLAAVVGGWWPARAAQRLVPAQAIKGLSVAKPLPYAPLFATLLLAAGALLSLAPPLFGMPLAAYLAVALLLVGGVVALPAAVGMALQRAPVKRVRQPLVLLALERARRLPHTGSVATSGVVASVALSVALTVMVASFRESVTSWLDVVLPAQLYVRTASSTNANNAAYLSEAFAAQVAALPGVRRADAVLVRPLQLDNLRPSVALVARPVQKDAANLPLVGTLHAVPAGAVALYVSEAFVDLYGAAPGQFYKPKLPLAGVNTAQAAINSIATSNYFIAGVWRDYARQHGSIVIDRADYLRLTGDARINDLALSLAPGADASAVQTAVRQVAEKTGAADLLEFASAAEIRAVSLRIFDRSFAVTYWLQAVAIGIGLFGVAASFSAQVLARRKEFGLLAHLGLTRAQVLRLVALEGLAWTTLGAAAGVALGLAVSAILVHVVNPQSFHWTMDMLIPWARLLLLGVAVVAAGTLTAWLSGRAAAGRDAVMAVKEDW
jgi:putative ABC transport system permease protein